MSSTRLSGVWVAREAPAQQQGQPPAGDEQVSAARWAAARCCAVLRLQLPTHPATLTALPAAPAVPAVRSLHYSYR